MKRTPRDLDAVEQSLDAFFAEARSVERAPSDLWERVRPQLLDSTTPALAASGGRRRVRRWVTAGVLAASVGLLSLLLLQATLGGGRVASAEEILSMAELAATSPQAAGIESLVATQRSVAYHLGEDQRGVPFVELESRVWYQAPNRQRVEGWLREFERSGAPRAEHSWVAVWDGVEYWTYDDHERTGSVLRQDPDADIFEQGALRGAAPLEVAADLYASACRTASVAGDDEVAGRATYIVELSRPRCGMTLPGGDGRRVIWVDRATGLILKTENYAADDRLYSVRAVESIELNGAVDPERLRFTPPTDAEIRDRTDQPLGIGTAFRMPQPPSVSLAEARDAATFYVRAPSDVPAGFELESVEHHWGNEAARGFRSHADWVLLRYADAEGNWLAITQGFGGLLNALGTIAPEDARQGTVDVKGSEAQWVDGSPTSRWEPGTMSYLRIDGGRMGEGWAVGPHGAVLRGSPLSIALASNVLTVEQLVAVAETLE